MKNDVPEIPSPIFTKRKKTKLKREPEIIKAPSVISCIKKREMKIDLQKKKRKTENVVENKENLVKLTLDDFLSEVKAVETPIFIPETPLKYQIFKLEQTEKLLSANTVLIFWLVPPYLINLIKVGI
jgi:hypothetical protein